MHMAGRRGQLSKLRAAFGGQSHQRRTLVIGIGKIFGYTVHGQDVHYALHALACVSQPSGNLGYGLIAAGRSAQDLPAGLGLADLPGNLIAEFAEGTGEFEYIGDDQRDEVLAIHSGSIAQRNCFCHIDSTLSRCNTGRMETQEIQFKGPAAYVRDLDRSRRFYEDVLGLKVARVMAREGRPIAVAYTAGLSIWDAGDAFASIFGSSAPDARHADHPVWENAFEVQDVDAMYERAMAAQSRFAHPLRELHWGQRTFRVYDPDGNVIDVGETHAAAVRHMVAGGMSHTQVAEKISLPVETVERFVLGG
jgi:catechol 2,3-dioxygenase-like lactoylglutathione lyase family enzyme